MASLTGIGWDMRRRRAAQRRVRIWTCFEQHLYTDRLGGDYGCVPRVCASYTGTHTHVTPFRSVDAYWFTRNRLHFLGRVSTSGVGARRQRMAAGACTSTCHRCHKQLSQRTQHLRHTAEL